MFLPAIFAVVTIISAGYMPEHPLSPIFEPKLPIKLAVPDSTPILSVNTSIVTGNVAKLEREVNASNKALDTFFK